MKMNKRIIVMACAVLLMTSACASNKEPTFGEKIQGQSAEMKVVGKQWTKGDDMLSEGQALIKAGNKDIDKGETLVSKGEKKVHKGEALVKKGSRLRSEAEELYKKKTQAPEVYEQY